MKRIFYSLILLLTACTAQQQEVAVVLPGIPKAAPQMSDDVRFSADDYKLSVDVRYNGDTVFVMSDLPEGIKYETKGADIFVHSSVEGAEFLLGGEILNNGSFTLVSEKPVLLSLSAITVKSYKRNAITVTAPLTHLRAIGASASYIIDGMPNDTVYTPKNSAAIRIVGDAVVSGGNIAVRGERSSAVHCSGHLIFCDGNFSVEAARKDAVLADSGIVVSGGNIKVVATNDALKSKKGNVVITDGNLMLQSSGSKGDAVQARNVYMFGGNLLAKVTGDASRGINSKAAVYIVGGILNIETSGSAIFSEKKSDYTSGACIKSETHLYIGDATILLKNSGDGGKGINCNGIMQIDGGTLLVENHGNDIQHSEDREAHTSAKGVKCDSVVIIKGGIIDIRAYGKGERCEGLESKYSMTIDGENTFLSVFAHDDAINAGKELKIKGGKIYAYSECNDGIDCNERITIEGGVVVANGCTSPEMGIDVDNPSFFSVKGGTIIAIGGAMGPVPQLPMGKESSQASVGWKTPELQRGKYIVVSDNDKSFFAYCLPRTLNDASVLFSSPELKEGREYTLSVVDNISGGEFLGNGLYLSPQWQSSVPSVQQKAEIIKIDESEIGGFPPPPPPGDGRFGGGFPPPPGDGKFSGGFPPPPPGDGKFSGGFPPPPPPGANIDNEGYNAANLPGGGWLLHK